MAGAGAPSYKVLGKGTYGVVFEPALPNVNADGNPLQFPGYVTKAFFDKKEYEKALTNATTLEKDVPSLHIPYQRYTRKVTRGNIPNSVFENTNLNYKPDRTPLYVIRMPHKGYSIRDICKDPVMLAKIVALPLEVKVREIYKLMNIVKALGDAGYVHGDLREPNILINPDAGIMTIIDFDLLKPTSVFGATFPSPYYHIPPEAVCLLTYKEPPPTSGPAPPPARSFWEKFLERFVKNGEDPARLMYRELFGNPAYYYNGVAEFHYPKFHEESLAYVTSFCDAVRAAGTPEEVETLREHADELMSKTVDSFSLAYCLRYLFRRLTLSGADGELKKFLLEDLFPKMTNGNAAARLRIEDAMREFKEFAKRSFGVTLDPPTAAAAVGAVEAEAARLEGLAAAAPAAPLSDTEVVSEIKKRLTSIEATRGMTEKDAAATEMMNFIRLNAIPFLQKHPAFRKVMIEKCNEFLKKPVTSAELKEACAALLAIIDPASVSAAAAAAASPPKSKSRSAAAAVAAPAAPDSARTLGSLRLSAASSTKSKKGSAAAAAIGDLAAAAAAAPAPPPVPVARATAAKKLTRAQRRRAQRKRAKTRNQARAAGNA